MGATVTSIKTVQMIALGQVIAHARRSAKKSQTELAAQVDVGQTMISRIERGTVTPDALLLRDIAERVGLSIEETHGCTDEAVKRAADIVRAALPHNDSTRWWDVAVRVGGILGFKGLVTFAVAAVMGER